MNLHEQLELLSAYVDGELDDQQAREVDAHLPTCAECRQTLDAIRATVADLGLLEDPVPGEQDSWALRSRLARARRSPGRFARAAAAAGSVAAVVIGFLAFSGGVPGRDQVGVSGQEDAAIAGMPMTTSAFSVEDIDFDEKSARAFFLGDSSRIQSESDPFTSEGAGPPTGSIQMLESPAASKDLQRKAAIDWNDAIARCEQVVLADARETYTPERFVGASFEGEPALLMVFSVGEGERARRELWVMDAATCQTLFWAQDEG